LDARLLDLIATVIGCCEDPREIGPGHPPAEIVRVLATLRRFLRQFLRQFLREGTPWRSLRATAGKASGSTLRRAFERWSRTGRCRRCTPCSSPQPQTLRVSASCAAILS